MNTSEDLGRTLARKLFAHCGNQTTIQVNEGEVAAIIAAACEMHLAAQVTYRPAPPRGIHEAFARLNNRRAYLYDQAACESGVHA